MADEANREGMSPLPPKLDLRKSGILKSVPAPAAVPMADDAPTMVPAAAAPAPAPVQPAPVAIPMPATPVAAPAAAPAPAIRVDAKPGAAVPGSGPRPTTGAPRPGAPAAGQPWRPGSGTGAAPKPVAIVSPGVRREGAPGGAPSAPVVTPAGSPGSVTAPKPLVSKKDTSRIPLDAAKPRVEKVLPVGGGEPSNAAGGEAPSTVRIVRPGETAQIGGLPRPVDMAAAEKRKTSRISLDSVLSEGASSDSSGPKTIRLKRPGEGPTSKVPGGAGAGESDEGPSEAGPGPTQRKTVVVKRTQESAAARKLSVARPAAGSGAPAAALSPDVVSAPVSEPHWSFGVIAIAAALVLCVVIYLFASQAFGPNSSMLQYSSWTGGPNLAWPGKTAWNP